MKPNIVYTLLEPSRTMLESLSLLRPSTLEPTHDPKMIMVIPGFMATDQSTVALRRGLDDMGHYVTGWDEGLNTGLDDEKLIRIAEQVRAMDDGFILIGHSLGGIYARQIAKMCPNVSKVICICSPVNLNAADAMTAIEVIYRKINRASAKTIKEVSHAPLCESIHLFSKTDGVLHWAACQQPAGVNIEIKGSHCGAVVNRKVIDLIGNML